MPKNPYEKHEVASEGVSAAVSAAGGAAGFADPMGGVLNAQAAYHQTKWAKAQMEDNQEAAALYQKSLEQGRPRDSAQWAAANPTETNGVTVANGSPVVDNTPDLRGSKK